jgi:acetoin utilization protein AcuB
MLVRDWMSREPVVISAKTSLEEAWRTMRENQVRHLPVVKKDRTIVGLVTLSDLLKAQPSPATTLSVWEINFLLGKMKVQDIMKTKVIVVDEECPVEEAALVMAERKIGCLPVVRGRELAGIITETDLFAVFTEQLAARETGVRVTLLLEDKKGELARLTGRVAEAGGNILSLTTLRGKESPHYVTTLKVEGIAQEALIKAVSPVAVKIVDAREGRGWGTEGFDPYHWTLEA